MSFFSFDAELLSFFAESLLFPSLSEAEAEAELSCLAAASLSFEEEEGELEEDVFELAAHWVLRLVVSPRVWARLLDELLL